MNTNYREYRPGKFQIYFSHKGKPFFIQKGYDRKPMRSPQYATNGSSIVPESLLDVAIKWALIPECNLKKAGCPHYTDSFSKAGLTRK